MYSLGFSREEARERDKAEPTNKRMGYLTHSTQNKYAKEYASDLRKSAVGIQERVIGTSCRHGEKKAQNKPKISRPPTCWFPLCQLTRSSAALATIHDPLPKPARILIATSGGRQEGTSARERLLFSLHLSCLNSSSTNFRIDSSSSACITCLRGLLL